MTTSTIDRVRHQLDQISELGPEEARGKIVALPATMCYEARYALQQVKETTQNPEQLLEVVEPLARAIGWAEALVFAFDTTKERETIKSFNQTHTFS